MKKWKFEIIEGKYHGQKNNSFYKITKTNQNNKPLYDL